MSTLKRAEELPYCYNGCYFGGCDGHTLRVEIQNTSDVMTFYDNDKVVASFEPDKWEVFIRMVDSFDYSSFTLTVDK